MYEYKYLSIKYRYNFLFFSPNLKIQAKKHSHTQRLTSAGHPAIGFDYFSLIVSFAKVILNCVKSCECMCLKKKKKPKAFIFLSVYILHQLFFRRPSGFGFKKTKHCSVNIIAAVEDIWRLFL